MKVYTVLYYLLTCCYVMGGQTDIQTAYEQSIDRIANEWTHHNVNLKAYSKAPHNALIQDIEFVGTSTKYFDNEEKLRSYILELIDIAINELNSNTAVREYLMTYPIMQDNIFINIGFKNELDGSRYSPPAFALATYRKGKIIIEVYENGKYKKIQDN